MITTPDDLAWWPYTVTHYFRVNFLADNVVYLPKSLFFNFEFAALLGSVQPRDGRPFQSAVL
jgi:hypothetical protein